MVTAVIGGNTSWCLNLRGTLYATLLAATGVYADNSIVAWSQATQVVALVEINRLIRKGDILYCCNSAAVCVVTVFIADYVEPVS